MSETQQNRPAAQAVPALEVPPDLKTEYANVVRIAHSPSELVFDFAHLLPGVTPATIFVPYSSIHLACVRPARPVMPWMRTLVSRLIRMLIYLSRVSAQVVQRHFL